MKMNTRAGFTILELLVVIAIIGILTAVVMAFVGNARTKGKIANIKANLQSANTQAELYFSTYGTYDGVCDNTQMQTILAALGDSAGTRKSCFDDLAPTGVLDWGMAAVLDNNNLFVAGPGGVLTVDTANTGATATQPNSITTCSNIGKKLPSVSQFKALHTAYGSAMPGVTGGYWTSTDDPANSANAYYIGLTNATGNYAIGAKSSASNRIRCAGR